MFFNFAGRWPHVIDFFILLLILPPPQNTTAVYNLYGITEVSSWATCHRISFPLPSSSLSSSSSANEHSLVPLGQPLLGTTVEVRDADTNSKVTQGRGIIWLGGQYRVCLIGSETTHPSASMRCSGDYASVNNEEGVVCTGRGDRQIKRQGHRINLDTIQQVPDKSLVVCFKSNPESGTTKSSEDGGCGLHIHNTIHKYLPENILLVAICTYFTPPNFLNAIFSKAIHRW